MNSAIILVNWNSWADTIECLDSILGASIPDTKIIVVDNDSTDKSIENIAIWLNNPKPTYNNKPISGVCYLSSSPHVDKIAYQLIEGPLDNAVLDQSVQISLIRSGGNLGFAGGNNVGLRLASNVDFQWFWLLNTDTVITPETLPELLTKAKSDLSYGIVGSTLAYYRDPLHVQAMGGATLNRRNTAMAHIGQDQPITSVPEDPSAIEAKMAYVVGASMLVSRRFLETVGYMQEDYFLYFEEIDWACRGIPPFKLGYAPKSIVYHKVGGSSSKVVSAFSLNLLYRNRIRFVSRFLPDRLASTRWALRKELIRHLLKARWMPAKLVARTLRDFNALVASAAPTQE